MNLRGTLRREEALKKIVKLCSTSRRIKAASLQKQSHRWVKEYRKTSKY